VERFWLLISQDFGRAKALEMALRSNKIKSNAYKIIKKDFWQRYKMSEFNEKSQIICYDNKINK
jgi:hypothetical protein